MNWSTPFSNVALPANPSYSRVAIARIVERGLSCVAGDSPRGERIVLDGRHLGTALADQPEEDARDLREMAHHVERRPILARALRAPLVGGHLRDLLGDLQGQPAVAVADCGHSPKGTQHEPEMTQTSAAEEACGLL